MGQWDERNDANGTVYNPTGNGHAKGDTLSADDTQAQLQEAFENARAEIDRYVSTAADFIRSRPVACVAGAVAIGFLVGKIASRK
jgi:ElaB/YqjD/DUF883 family membrane-anchored ribosome-binding protein